MLAALLMQIYDARSLGREVAIANGTTPPGINASSNAPVRARVGVAAALACLAVAATTAGAGKVDLASLLADAVRERRSVHTNTCRADAFPCVRRASRAAPFLRCKACGWRGESTGRARAGLWVAGACAARRPWATAHAGRAGAAMAMPRAWQQGLSLLLRGRNRLPRSTRCAASSHARPLPHVARRWTSTRTTDA